MGVIQMSSKKFMPVLSGKVIENKEDQEVVLVNTNRLYEKLALAMRSIIDDKEREKVVEVQKKALAKMKTEREMFVPMTVEEVKDMRLNLWDKPSSTPYWPYISAKIQKIFRKVI